MKKDRTQKKNSRIISNSNLTGKSFYYIMFFLNVLLTIVFIIIKSPKEVRAACSGGNITTSGSDVIHTFLDSGTFTSYDSMNISYLIIAGGGGGGANKGAGGGGGGFLTGSTAYSGGSSSVIIGSSGVGGECGTSGFDGCKGGDSSFYGKTATGGGGGSSGGAPARNGYSGGSGGGAAAYYGPMSSTGGSGTSGQGYKGGDASISISWNYWCAAGGGGVGGAASNLTCSADTGGLGGVGRSSSIAGSSITYACGGSGYPNASKRTGGCGASHEDGTPNTGGGAGAYKDGGTGLVILRYTTGQNCTDCDPYSSPGCPTGYGQTNTGCSSTGIQCDDLDSCNTSCGTTAGTCYLVKKTVTYDGNGGSCTYGGNSYQDVCYNTDAAAPSCTRSGYSTNGFTRTSGSGGTLNTTTGAVTGVTADQTIQVDWISPPLSPTDPYCEGTSNPTGVVDTTPEFSAVFEDPISSESAPYYQIQVNTNSSFTGTVMWDSGKSSITPVAEGSRSSDITYAGTSLSVDGTTYYWRIKFWDNDDAEGEWSTVQNFRMNYPPSSPTTPQCEETSNPTGVSDTTPEFSAVCQDLDSSQTCNYYEIEVDTTKAFSSTVWDSDIQPMTSTSIGLRSPEISYNGSILSATTGRVYFWRIRFSDNLGTVGEWSEIQTFIMAGTTDSTFIKGLRLRGITIE